MSYRGKSTGLIISDEEYNVMLNILQHYRYERKTTVIQQEAILIVLNDFNKVIE